MDSEKDMEEYQGQPVFVSQLLDWDSLNHQLIIPAEKAEAFKAHFNNNRWQKGFFKKNSDGELHSITVLFEKGGYKAFPKQIESSSIFGENSILLCYSDKLALALKNKFARQFSWFMQNKDKKGEECPEKIRIYFTESFSLDIFLLKYEVESNQSSSGNTTSANSMNDSLLSPKADMVNVSTSNDSPMMTSSQSDNPKIDDSSDELTQIAPSSDTQLLDNETKSYDFVDSSEIFSFLLSDDIPSLAYTKPIDFIYQGQTHTVNNWTDFIVKIANIIYKTHYGFLLKNAKPENIDFTNRYCIGSSADGMVDPKQIGLDLWIETDLSATQLGLFAEWMAWWCNLEPNDFLVHYGKEENANNRGIGKDVEPSLAQEKIKHFTFYDKIPDLHHTKPIDFVYLNEKYYVNNWPDFVVQIAKILLDNPFGTRLKTATKTKTGFSKKLCTDKMISNMVSPRQVAKDLWIETAMSATTLAKFAQWMVIWCILPPNAFLIHYQHNDNNLKEPNKQELSTSETAKSRKEETVKNAEEHESTKVVLPADQSKKHVTVAPNISNHKKTINQSWNASFSLADEIPTLVDTQPVDVTFMKELFVINNWADLAVQIAKLAYTRSKHGDLLKEATDEDIDFTSCHCIAETSDGMISPRQIVDGLWIETKFINTGFFNNVDFNDKQLIRFAKWMVWWVDLDQHSFIIHYNKNKINLQKSDILVKELPKNSNEKQDSISHKPSTLDIESLLSQSSSPVASNQVIKKLEKLTQKIVQARAKNDDRGVARLHKELKKELRRNLAKIQTRARENEDNRKLLQILLEMKKEVSENNFTNTSLRITSQHVEEETDNSHQIIFSKRLNWSMITLGMTIPVDIIPTFFANLSFQPVRGNTYPITLIWDGKEYSAKVEEVNYSSANHNQTVQIRYTKSTPISIAFQTRFQSAYQQLQNDRKNIEGINTFITLVTTNRQDCFELKVSTEQGDTYQPAEQLTLNLEETNDNSDTIKPSTIIQENIDSEFTEECRQVLETAFPRGFKNGSVIDRNKFASKYEELMGKPLADEIAEHVWEACSSVGIVVEDVVFPSPTHSNTNTNNKQFEHFNFESNQTKVVAEMPLNTEYSDNHVVSESVSPEFLDFTNKCEELLEEYFVNGFRLNSPIANKRFRSFWEEKYLDECIFNDYDIQKAMKQIGVEFEERIYAPKQLASQEVLDEIIKYIVNLFSEGKKFIYYQALFDEFVSRGTDWKINSPKMLKNFLVANHCSFSFRRSCIAIDNEVEVSPILEIRDYLHEQQEPVGYDKIQVALPNIPLDVIKHELTTNTEFVNASRGEYIHADIVDLSDSDLELIADLIRSEIRNKGYITGSELWKKMETEYPEYTIKYSYLPLVGFRDSLKHKFTGKFNFTGNIISSVDDPIRMVDIFAGFCKSRNSFNMEELDRLREDVDSPVIYFEPIYENSIRVSQDEFVSPESISFDIDAVDKAIRLFCNGDFIAITDITSFAAFPPMEVQWTSYLVESFVSKYSKQFKLFHNQYNATVCAGAILRIDAKLYDYNQVLAVVLAKSKCELDSSVALNYLCNSGFLGRRRYADIDIVLSEARQIRSRKR